MTQWIGSGKPTRFLFLCVVLGLIALGPLQTAVAELDDPPRSPHGEKLAPSQPLALEEGYAERCAEMKARLFEWYALSEDPLDQMWHRRHVERYDRWRN